MDWVLGPTMTAQDPWVLFGMTEEEWEHPEKDQAAPVHVWEIRVQD
jgi:hypothetical protein